MIRLGYSFNLFSKKSIFTLLIFHISFKYYFSQLNKYEKNGFLSVYKSIFQIEHEAIFLDL